MLVSTTHDGTTAGAIRYRATEKLTARDVPVSLRIPSAVVSTVRLKYMLAHWPPTAAVLLTFSAAR